MKKLNSSLRRILVICGIFAVIGGTALATSTITTKMIEAQYMGIKLVVDGIEVAPKDATGKVVEPFVSQGTTYLPVRAIATALDKPVEWDGTTKTVYVGDIPGKEINWMTKLPPYQINSSSKQFVGNSPQYFTVSGEKYGTGISLESNKGYALWNTNGQYKSATMTIGHIDSTPSYDITLHLYVDEVLVKSYDFAWDGAPKTIELPLDYGLNVKLEVDKNARHNANYGIYDISFAE